MNNDMIFKKNDRIERIKAFLLVSPLLLFVLVFFVTPICIILIKGIYNPKVKTLLPNTVISIQNYNYKQPFPNEDILKVFVKELQNV